MATTIPLNSLETVWVTTYYGGAGVGTCFDISMQLDAETQLTATFNVKDLHQVLENAGSIHGLAKPEFDIPGEHTPPQEMTDKALEILRLRNSGDYADGVELARMVLDFFDPSSERR